MNNSQTYKTYYNNVQSQYQYNNQFNNNNGYNLPTIVWIKESPIMGKDFEVYNNIKDKYKIIHLYCFESLQSININQICFILCDQYIYSKIAHYIKNTLIIQINSKYDINQLLKQIHYHSDEINISKYHRMLPINSNQIKFYNKTDPYYEFTNFYMDAPFELNGLWWKTSEHYFQAQKFSPYNDLIEKIRNLHNPRDVFDMARDNQYKQFIRSDWHDVRDIFMYEALKAKFTQNYNLKQLLLSTGNLNLIEDSPYDSYWGCGKDGHGENKLGILLMKLRSFLNDN